MKESWICGAVWRRGFWLRIFGYGLAVSADPPCFSERNGYRKTLRVFGVKFEWLAP